MTPFAQLVWLLLAAPSTASYEAEIMAAVLDVESIHYVPPALVQAIIRCESDFNPQAISRAGAVGLMQVMPFNARRLGIAPDDLWRPSQNILAGVRLLAVLLKYYDGDLISALVAYNARPRRLFDPIPRNSETPRYVAAVLRHYHSYSASLRQVADGHPSFFRAPRRRQAPTATWESVETSHANR